MEDSLKRMSDPLGKLKEERYQLLEWSKKLKNYNPSFLEPDEMEKEDYREKMRNKKPEEIEKGDRNLYTKISSIQANTKNHIITEYKSKEHRKREHSLEETNNEMNDNAMRLRIKGMMGNECNINVQVNEHESSNERPTENFLSKYQVNNEKQIHKKKTNLEKRKDGKTQKGKELKTYNSLALEEQTDISKDFDKLLSSNLTSLDVSNEIFSIENQIKTNRREKKEEGIFTKRNQHMYQNEKLKNNEEKQTKLKNISDSLIREPLCKAITNKGTNETINKLEHRSFEKLNRYISNNEDPISNTNTPIKRKKTIKIRRKNKKQIEEGDEMSQNSKLYSNSQLSNVNEPIYNGNNYRISKNKSSNDSVDTFLPITSILQFSNNGSGTTVNSNSRESNSKDTYLSKIEGMDQMKEGKMMSHLKDKVNILEKKKENLNDKLTDMYDNVYTLVDNNKKNDLVIQHYEALVRNLESKYNKLFNMYQELDEHRISYIDAYREKQTKIENLCACLQIKSEENLKITQEVSILNKKVEEFQGQIYEYMKDLEEKEKLLQLKKQEILELKTKIEQLQNEISSLKKELEQLTKDYQELLEKNKNMEEELQQMNQKYTQLEEKFQNINEFFLSKVDNLQYIINKLIHIFKLNDENVSNYVSFFKENAHIIEEKLKDNDSKYEEIMAILDKGVLEQIKKEVIDREKEHEEQKQEMQNIFDHQLLLDYEKNLKNVELAQDHIYRIKEKLAMTTNQRNCIKNRVVLLSHGQGRLNNKPIIEELKQINKGTPIFKFKYHTFTHKPVPIYMKLINNQQLTWTKDKQGLKRFKKKNLVEVKDICSIEYGLNSRPVYWHIEKHNAKKLEKKQIQPKQRFDNTYNIDPFKCFTIHTKKRAYDFFSDKEDTIASWVISLGRLASQYSTSPNIQSRSEFIVKKVQLKLKLYCIKNDITYTQLWVAAINKTKNQLNT